MKTAHPYQVEGARVLASKRYAMLGDEMGLGKTLQALRACQRLPECFARRVLIVCPAIARLTWKREIIEELGGPFSIFTHVLENFHQDPPSRGWAICSYDYARQNRAKLAAAGPWDVLIIDEAQLVRTHGASRTKALFGREGIARRCERVWWLTGTPIEHTPAELWLPLYFSGHTRLSFEQWCEHYCTMAPSPYGERPVGLSREPGRGEELRELMRASGFYIRRTKEEVGLQLPALSIHRVPVRKGAWASMSAEMECIDFVAVDAERRLLDAALGKMEHGLNADIYAELQGLAQSVSTLLRYIGLCKVESAVALVLQAHELTGRPAVVFAKHTSVLEALATRFATAGLRVGTIDGSTDSTTRGSLVDLFQAGRIDILCGQLRAAGTNLTLTAADTVYVVETEWDPSSLAQAVARCHRIGQRHPVAGYVLELVDEPLDVAVQKLIARKAREIAEVLG